MERKMDWTEIILEVAIRYLETASAIAQMAASQGLYIEDYSKLEEEIENLGFGEMIDEELLNRDRTKALIHIYISPEEDLGNSLIYLVQRLEAGGIPYQVRTNKIREEDWVDNWKKYFKPLEVGQKLVIKPSWEKYDVNSDRLVLEIDPGMAFGSGTHESTRLCLACMEKYIMPEAEVLDVGCGSGILSIAALLLGASHVTALDIDPLAIKITRENMALNRISPEKYKAEQGNLLTSQELRDKLGEYDLVLVNIVADVIISLVPIIWEHTRAGGCVICSGIIAERTDDVISALEAAGYKIKEISRENDWIGLVGIKQGSH